MHRECVFELFAQQMAAEVLASRPEAADGQLGIILTKVRFEAQEFVDSYLFGRSLAMA